MQVPPQRDYWPTEDWRGAPPQELGMNPAILARLHEDIEEHLPGLHALLIVRHGYLVFERYYQGFSQKSYHSISSATKSLISALIGVTLNQGLLTSLDQPMLDFFHDYAVVEQDPRKHAVTLRHLLALQAGFSNEMQPEYWRNPVRLALQRQMAGLPGQCFVYDSPAVDILSGILTRLTGKRAAAFADASLFKTLGIWRDPAIHFLWQHDPEGAHTWHGDAFWDEKEGYPWKVDPQGHSTGSFGAHLTAREMAKLGYLYLNHGLWDGQQIIPVRYVMDSTRQQSSGGPPVGLPYGYLWWITHDENYEAFFASGFGGKLIYIIPGADLVIVTAASSERARQQPGQWKEVMALIPRFILPAANSNEHKA